jgi:hypothetical protein
MIDAIEPDRVQPGIAQNNFQARFRRGIVLHDVRDIFPHSCNQAHE